MTIIRRVMDHKAMDAAYRVPAFVVMLELCIR